MENQKPQDMGDLELVGSASLEERSKDPMEALAEEIEIEGPVMDEDAHLAGGGENDGDSGQPEGDAWEPEPDAVVEEEPLSNDEMMSKVDSPLSEAVIAEVGLPEKDAHEDVERPETVGNKFREDEVRQGVPVLKETEKKTFNPAEIQNALVDDEENEGGVVTSASRKSAMTKTNNVTGGGIIKPAPDMFEDSVEGKFEVTGFEASYEDKGETKSVNIRDYFDDLDTAKASVISGQYLMPLDSGGFKISQIKGNPTISYNERQIWGYRNGEWSRS